MTCGNAYLPGIEANPVAIVGTGYGLSLGCLGRHRAAKRRPTLTDNDRRCQ
jgi:hypothetical protein